MARKKSIFFLVTAFIFMALVSTGCERSYAPINESLATPTLENGEAFPEELPEDMEDVFAIGAQTATAEALSAMGETPPAEDPTATPAAEDSELTPEDSATDETPTATEESAPPTSTAPVVDPTETPVPTTEPVDTNNLPSNYTLRKGEFPYCIARRFNVDPSELLSLNGISSSGASTLQPGLTLKIPQTGNPFPYTRARNTHPVTYVVPETTTVYDIACFFGDVDPAKIISLNSISNPDSVAAGTSLQIP